MSVDGLEASSARADGGAFTAPAPRRRLSHVPALDGVRGVAVLVVVGFHAFGLLAPVWQWLPGGFLGVDVFFVLSGFLITSLLIGEHDRRGRIGLGGFYRRRALRLLPALVLLLVAHFIYSEIIGSPTKIELQTAGVVLFYFLNWWAVLGHPFSTDLGHLWSLSVEEQFYLVWPLVVLLFVSFRRRLPVVVTILVVAVSAVVLHRIVLWQGGAPKLSLHVRTDTRADGLLIGTLLAVLWTQQKIPRRGLGVAATVSVGFLAYCIFTPRPFGFYADGGFTAVAVASAVILLAVVESEWLGNIVLGFAALRAIGRVSYGLYLWHHVVMFAVARESAHIKPVMRFVIALGLTAAITCASWFLVERPFLRWKDRLEARSKAAPPDRS